MGLDVARIEEKIRRLQELKRIAADPELVKLLQEEMFAERNGSPGKATEQHGVSLKPSDFVAPAVPEEIEEDTASRGLLMRTVIEVVKSTDGPIMVTSVINEMLRRGFRFASKTPKASVSIALRKLESRQMIRVINRGKGSAPTIYRRVEEKH